MINKIRYASITVTNIDRAIDFYINLLGFRKLVEMPLQSGNSFVMVAPPGGGSNLVFSLPTPGKSHILTSSISFEADDVESTYHELTTRGVEFSRPPSKTTWGGVEAVFVDPFGNSFLLQQGGL